MYNNISYFATAQISRKYKVVSKTHNTRIVTITNCLVITLRFGMEHINRIRSVVLGTVDDHVFWLHSAPQAAYLRSVGPEKQAGRLDAKVHDLRFVPIDCREAITLSFLSL